MSLLEKHLEQIELCSNTISELPFPQPKIFTNAMLHNHDITALIRDTEDHERALFSLAPGIDIGGGSTASEASSRRVTAFPAPEHATNPPHFQAPRKGTAVAAVLGGDLSERIKREYRRDPQLLQGDRKQEKDTLDVELLLRGAEKLCGVYPLSGALDRIAILRSRNAKVTASTQKYEDLVAEQSEELGQMNKSSGFGVDDDTPSRTSKGTTAVAEVQMTEEDLKREEDGIVELEKRKQLLEERVTGMEKDLGGLLR